MRIMKESPTIIKTPVLKTVEDFYELRRRGIGYIEKLGSDYWTDFNLTDSGIAILEAYIYALTDLGYRTGWKMRDLLAPETYGSDTHQPFFTAREILTVNPWTPDDFRRLLIDLDGVRNAWMVCKECACDVFLYAWCDAESNLQLGYELPSGISEDKSIKVQALGLYEALLELESDPVLGDLNDRKIIQKFTLTVGTELESYELELHFPDWALLHQDAFEAFRESTDDPIAITISKFSRSKTASNIILTPELRQFWNGVFYVTFTFTAGGMSIVIPNAALRIFSNTAVKNVVTVADLIALLQEKSNTGFIQLYRRKLVKVADQITAAKKALHDHRNLDEDFCRIKQVAIEDIAICADVEVAPAADIEWVQAKIWFEIQQYMNPPIPFYSLKEMVEKDIASEDIFNGPPLESGFILQKDLDATGLKTVLYASDIINRLMDIDGVIAINHLLMTKYDADGQLVRGAADIGLTSYSPAKISAEWTMAITANHQPRLYFNLSSFLFFKNGLPFTPRKGEAEDTLLQLHGESERIKIKDPVQDFPIPTGVYRDPADYYPVQYSLPRLYGISPIGLPGHVGPIRIAQARQLKAYLMVFEQVLINQFEQLAHVSDLFSLSPLVNKTYFSSLIDDALINDSAILFNGYNQNTLDALTESKIEFQDRRNRFLDHILTRFGEHFDEYALLLNTLEDNAIAADELIKDKISFLKAYPVISSDRSRAMDYKDEPCSPESRQPGLKRRINLLLGYPDLTFAWTVTNPVPGSFDVVFELEDGNKSLWLIGVYTVTTSDEDQAKKEAHQEIITQMTDSTAYVITQLAGGFELTINDQGGNLLATHPQLFALQKDAEQLMDELTAWAAQHRMILVEHLLLRPKFPGDALFPICSEGECHTCDADPYSFRLTFVMPAWNNAYRENLDLRAFANKTIMTETPSHLLPKVCWVGNNGFDIDSCDPMISTIAAFLEQHALTAGGIRPTSVEACTCAMNIYQAYSTEFKTWFDDKKLMHFTEDALYALLPARFNPIDLTAITCAAVLTTDLVNTLKTMLLDYYVQLALKGFQFEKFEDAWCAWLEANAKVDWEEIKLNDRIEALLEMDNLSSNDPDIHDKICQCAAAILAAYGTQFYQWMKLKIGTGLDWTLFGSVPDPVFPVCSGVVNSSATQQKIKDMLVGTLTNPGYYADWVEVSFRLWTLLDLLGKLTNVYPTATLHDCDDGSDINPVRLNTTALGGT
ncbi:MAG TPA: hypothetical protein VLA46_03040 [Saprospiraceae bacterium]|nr:hypothetical protein [Saprospiraceae bacterium]